MSIAEMSLKCRLNISKWVPSQVNLTVILRQCGKEKSVRNSKRNFQRLATEAEGLWAILSVTLHLQSKKNLLEC